MMTSNILITSGAASLSLSVLAWLMLGFVSSSVFGALLVLSLLLLGVGLVLLSVGVVAKVIALGVREGRH